MPKVVKESLKKGVTKDIQPRLQGVSTIHISVFLSNLLSMGQMGTDFLRTDPSSLHIGSAVTSALTGKLVLQCYQVTNNVI